MHSDEKYEIIADAARSLLRIKLVGHWDIATVDRYKQAVSHAVTRMYAAGCRRGNVSVLVDARNGGAQSQDVVAYFRAQLNDDALHPRRLATLVSSTLLKRQVERIAIPNQRLFTDERAAIEWLLEA